MTSTDNVAYLREWAADMRKYNGKSIDADRCDAIADEIERLRAERDTAKDQLHKANELVEHYKAERDKWWTRTETAEERYVPLLDAEIAAIEAVTIEKCAQAADAAATQQRNDYGAANTGGAALAAEFIRALAKPAEKEVT